LARGEVPPNVGQVVVFWGLCGLGLLDPNSESARRLWAELELAVRESSLTDAFRRHENPWCLAARWLAAYWPKIFPEDPPAGSAGSLDDFLSCWVGPEMSFALLALEFRRQGVTAAQLKRSIPDGNLLRHGVDDVKQISRHDPRSTTASGIGDLADEIDNLPPGNRVMR
jgi:hypothetical protein